MKKEKKFQIPEVEIVEFVNDDIITTSDVDEGWNDMSIPPYPGN